VGEIIAGRYVLVRARGEGMMGVVYEADDRATGQRVALKVLRPEMTAVAEVAERLAREGRVIAQMRNPHVVRVLDVGTTGDGLPFFAMELLEGNDLAALLDRGRMFSIGEAVRLARQACAGLAEAHALNVIHRDVKPHNMFLARGADGETRLVLLDFGVSKILGAESDLTLTQSSIGTPLYMAPEQVRSARNVDERTDVWALAVVLFELCTGSAPFDGESAHAVTAAIVADPPKRLRELLADAPEALEKVIGTALEKDPARRYPSALAFSDALLPFDTGEAPLPMNEQATLVTQLPFDFMERPPPSSARERTQLAPPQPRPHIHATIHEEPLPPSQAGFLPAGGAVPSWRAAGSEQVRVPQAPPPPTRLLPALLAVTVVLALLGVGLLVMLGLDQRKPPSSGGSSSTSTASERVGTVSDALAAARESQGLSPFEPCVFRTRDKTLVAVAPREALPDAMADVDSRMGSSPPPSFMLEGSPAKGTGDITLVAVTPLSPAMREPATPLLVVTDEHLYVGFLGERAFEKVDTDPQRAKLKETVVRGAQHWVVAAEAKAPIASLETALGLLADSGTSVTFSVPLAATTKREPTAANAGSACEAGSAKGARWISDAEWTGVGPATRVSEEACGREAPWLSGRSVRVLTFPGAREACLEEPSVPGEGQACALDAAKKIALGLPMSKKAEPVRFDFVFRGPPVRALCGK